jgi:SnoaL-like domain
MVEPGPAMDAIARRFVDALNRRDAQDLVALTDPAVQWRPAVLAGRRRAYLGHDGVRRWLADLGASSIEHHAHVLDVRMLDQCRFLALAEVLVDGDAVCPAALVAALSADGKIIEAREYLSDEQMLVQAGILTADGPPAPAPARAEAQSPPGDPRSAATGDRAATHSRAA